MSQTGRSKEVYRIEEEIDRQIEENEEVAFDDDDDDEFLQILLKDNERSPNKKEEFSSHLSPLGKRKGSPENNTIQDIDSSRKAPKIAVSQNETSSQSADQCDEPHLSTSTLTKTLRKLEDEREVIATVLDGSRHHLGLDQHSHFGKLDHELIICDEVHSDSEMHLNIGERKKAEESDVADDNLGRENHKSSVITLKELLIDTELNKNQEDTLIDSGKEIDSFQVAESSNIEEITVSPKDKCFKDKNIDEPPDKFMEYSLQSEGKVLTVRGIQTGSAMDSIAGENEFNSQMNIDCIEDDIELIECQKELGKLSTQKNKCMVPPNGKLSNDELVVDESLNESSTESIGKNHEDKEVYYNILNNGSSISRDGAKDEHNIEGSSGQFHLRVKKITDLTEPVQDSELLSDLADEIMLPDVISSDNHSLDLDSCSSIIASEESEIIKAIDLQQHSECSKETLLIDEIQDELNFESMVDISNNRKKSSEVNSKDSHFDTIEAIQSVDEVECEFYANEEELQCLICDCPEDLSIEPPVHKSANGREFPEEFNPSIPTCIVPGLDYLVCTEPSRFFSPILFDCLPCQTRISGPGIMEHIKSRDHHLNAMQSNMHEPRQKLKCLSSTQIEEAKGDSLDDLFRRMYMSNRLELEAELLDENIQLKRGMTSLESEIRNMQLDDDKLKTPPTSLPTSRKVIEEHSKKMKFSTFSRVALVGSSIYKALLDSLHVPNLIDVFILKNLKFGDLKKFIQKNKKKMPPSTLWLGITGYHSFIYCDQCSICMTRKCHDSIRSLYLKEGILHSDPKEASARFSNRIKNLSQKINEMLNERSEFFFVPPIPLQVVDVSNMNHEDVHKIKRAYPLSYCIETDQILTTLKKFYPYLSRDIILNVMGASKYCASEHPLKKYLSKTTKSIEVLVQISSSNIFKEWQEAMKDMLSYSLSVSLPDDFPKKSESAEKSSFTASKVVQSNISQSQHKEETNIKTQAGKISLSKASKDLNLSFGNNKQRKLAESNYNEKLEPLLKRTKACSQSLTSQNEQFDCKFDQKMGSSDFQSCMQPQIQFAPTSLNAPKSMFTQTVMNADNITSSATTIYQKIASTNLSLSPVQPEKLKQNINSNPIYIEELLFSLSAASSRVKTLYKVDSYDKVFLVGRKSQLDSMNNLPYNFEKIEFKLNFAHKPSISALIKLFGSFSRKTTACFLIFDLSSFVRKPTAHKVHCKHPLCKKENILYCPDYHCISEVEYFMKELSKEVTSFILPLYPNVTYFVTDRSVVDHDLAHGLLDQNGLLLYGSTDIWNEFFATLRSKWNYMLKINHSNTVSSSLVVIRYIKEDLDIHAVGYSHTNKGTFLSQITIWKAFCDCFLSALVKSTNYMPSIETSKDPNKIYQGSLFTLSSQDPQSIQQSRGSQSAVSIIETPSKFKQRPEISIALLNERSKEKNAELISSLSRFNNTLKQGSVRPIFEKVIFIGRFHLLSLLKNLPYDNYMIDYSMGDIKPETQACRIFEMVGSFKKGTTACFLLFDCPHFALEGSSFKLKCSKSNCSSKTWYSTMHPSSQGTVKEHLSLCLEHIHALLKKLNETLPTFLLPLYPKVAFHYNFKSKFPFDHEFIHRLPTNHCFLAIGGEHIWFEHFLALQKEWANILVNNHKGHLSFDVCKKFLIDERKLCISGSTLEDFNTEWSEEKIWRAFVDLFLAVLVRPYHDIESTLLNSAAKGQATSSSSYNASSEAMGRTLPELCPLVGPPRKRKRKRQRMKISSESKAAELPNSIQEDHARFSAQAKYRAPSPLPSAPRMRVPPRSSTSISDSSRHSARTMYPDDSPSIMHPTPTESSTLFQRMSSAPTTSTGVRQQFSSSIRAPPTSSTLIVPPATVEQCHPLGYSSFTTITTVAPLATGTTMPQSYLPQPSSSFNESVAYQPPYVGAPPMLSLLQRASTISTLAEAVEQQINRPHGGRSSSHTLRMPLPRVPPPPPIISSCLGSPLLSVQKSPLDFKPFLSTNLTPASTSIKKLQQKQEIVIEISNVSDVLPLEFFKALATSVDLKSTVSNAERGKVEIKLTLMTMAQIIVKKLNRLHLGDCVLKASCSNFTHVHNITKLKDDHINSLFANVLEQFQWKIVGNILTKIMSGVLDVLAFKTQRCQSSCKDFSSCINFHLALIDERRNPQIYPYNAKMCNSINKKTGSCNRGVNCKFCHNIYEHQFHPSVYQKEACAYEILQSSKCPKRPLCSFAHRDTPELLYSDFWKDCVVFGLLNSFLYLAGAIRGRYKAQHLSSSKILFITPDSEMLDMMEASVRSTADRYRIQVVNLGRVTHQPCKILSEVVIGTTSKIVEWEEFIFNSSSSISVIILDNVGKFYRSQFEMTLLEAIFRKLRVNCPSLSSVSKVFVADSKEKAYICRKLERLINATLICIDEIKEEDFTGHSHASGQPFTAFSKSRRGSQTPFESQVTPTLGTKPPVTLIPPSQLKEKMKPLPARPAHPSSSKSSSKEFHSTKSPSEGILRSLSPRSRRLGISRDRSKGTMSRDWSGSPERKIRRTRSPSPQRNSSLSSKPRFPGTRSKRSPSPKESVRTRIATSTKENLIIVKTFEILGQLEEQLGLIAPAINALSKECRSKDNDTTAIFALLNEDTSQMLIKMLLDKLKQNVSRSGGEIPLFKTALIMTEKLYKMAKKGPESKPESATVNVTLDLESIASVTLGKNSTETLAILKTAFAYEGILQPSLEQINDAFLKVCSLHVKSIIP